MKLRSDVAVIKARADRLRDIGADHVDQNAGTATAHDKFWREVDDAILDLDDAFRVIAALMELVGHDRGEDDSCQLVVRRDDSGEHVHVIEASGDWSERYGVITACDDVCDGLILAAETKLSEQNPDN